MADRPPLSEKQQAVADLAAQHLQDAGCAPGDAIDLAAALTRKGWRVPVPKALPEYRLNPFQGARPPWAWMNLADTTSDVLEASVQEWVEQYNATMALEADDIIPACWRRHPPLVQVLPPLFWSWHNTHRHPQAGASQAIEWHLRTLPTFQTRLDQLIGEGAAMCRKGEHTGGWNGDTESAMASTVDSYRWDVGQHPEWRAKWFGTAP